MSIYIHVCVCVNEILNFSTLLHNYVTTGLERLTCFDDSYEKFSE